MTIQRFTLILTLTATCGAVLADAAGKSAKAKAVKEEAIQAKVVSVTGQAGYRNPTDAKGKYKSIKAGDKLNELAIIRMGLGAKLELQFSDRVNLTATGGGKFGLRTLRKRGDVVRANVGLKYGSLRLKVDSTVGENDFSVTTPVATLSARGCNCFVAYFPDSGLNFANTHDTWVVSSSRGKKTNQNLDPTGEIVSKELNTQQSDPYGLGNVENTNLRNNGGGRGVMDFGSTANGGINTGGPVTPKSSSCPSPCPGNTSGGYSIETSP